MSVLWITPFCT